ncbi:MAG: hypothetical protein ACOCQD_03565, partial [archaeon]
VFKTEEEALEHSRKLFEEPYYKDVIEEGFNPDSIEILRDNDDLFPTKEKAIIKAVERYDLNV